MKRSAFRDDAAASLLVRFIAYGIGFAAAVASSRALGASGKGALGLASSVAGMGATVLGMGLGSAYTVSIARGELRPKVAAVLVFVYSAVVTVFMLLVLKQPSAARLLHLDSQSIIVTLGGAAVGGLILADACAGILQGVGRVRLGMALRHVAGLSQSVGIIAIAALSVRSAVPYVVVVVAAAWTAGLAAVVFVLKNSAVTSGGTYAMPLGASIYKTVALGIRTQGIWILLMLNYRVDMLLLGALRTTAEVGVYSVAVGFSEAAWLGANAIVAVLLPHVSQTSVEVTRRAARAARVAVLLTAVSALVIGTALVAWGAAVFGSEFSISGWAFAALSPGLVMFCWYKVLATYSVGQGRVRAPAILAAIGLALNIGLNIVLIPMWGSVGAGAASSVSYSLVAIAMVVLFSRANRVSIASVVRFRASDYLSGSEGVGR